MAQTAIRKGFFYNLRTAFFGSASEKKKDSRRLSADEIYAVSMLESTSNARRNASYWAGASNMYADQVASGPDRATASARCRKELMNSGNMMNAVRAMKNHVVGASGPTLKLTPSKNNPLDPKVTQGEIDLIAWEWHHWMKATGNVEKLKHIIGALIYDGEAFLMSVYDPYSLPTELNYQEIEASRIRNPYTGSVRENEIDGIVFDGMHPVMYYVEKKILNPNFSSEQRFDQIPACYMLHIANLDLIDQHRGLPAMQCGLQMMLDIRAWTMHTIAAANQAARGGAGFVEIDKECPIDFDEAMDIVSGVNPGDLRVLWPGAKANVPDAKFPTSTFGEFYHKLWNQVAAAIGSAGCIMMADTADLNYSSYKGLRQNYYTNIESLQHLLNDRILDRQFNQWFECMSKKNQVFDRIYRAFGGHIGRLSREWKYAQPPSVDPLKDVTAWKIHKELGTLSTQMICEENGVDYDDVQNDFEQDNKNAVARLVDQVAEVITNQQKEMVKNIVSEAMLSVQASGDFTPPDPAQPSETVNENRWEDFRKKVDGLGVAVRAGVLTATPDVEEQIRREAGLLPMSEKLKESWQATGDIRQPITLKESESKAVEETLGVDAPPGIAAESAADDPEDDDPDMPTPEEATETELPFLLSAKQAGEKLNVSAAQISSWRRDGLPCKRFRGRIKYDLKKLIAWINSKDSDNEETTDGNPDRPAGEETVDV